MKITKYVLVVALLSVFSCRERNNIFDVGSDEFAPPPAMKWVVPIGAWYDPYFGHIVGIRIQPEFYSAFEKVTPLTHILYQDSNECVRVDTTIAYGLDRYQIDVFYGMDVGEWSVRIYFGEIAIGACNFEVIPGPEPDRFIAVDENGIVLEKYPLRK